RAAAREERARRRRLRFDQGRPAFPAALVGRAKHPLSEGFRPVWPLGQLCSPLAPRNFAHGGRSALCRVFGSPEPAWRRDGPPFVPHVGSSASPGSLWTSLGNPCGNPHNGSRLPHEAGGLSRLGLRAPSGTRESGRPFSLVRDDPARGEAHSPRPGSTHRAASTHTPC